MKAQSILSILIAFSLVLTACSSTKNAAKSAIENDSKTQKDIVFASLDRGYCFGTCKVFSVKIYKSGLVEYEGKANVDQIGFFTGQISKSELSKIEEVAKEIKFESLDEVYDDPKLMDVPGHKSGLLINGQFKTVYRRVNYPESIKLFENQIEEALASIKLIPVNQEK